jgi:DNA-binding HxlR family transcriptional regulator
VEVIGDRWSLLVLRAEYSLTEAAIQLVPVMAALGRRAHATKLRRHRCKRGLSCWLAARRILGTT